MELEYQLRDIEGFLLSPQQKHLWRLQHEDLKQPYGVQCKVSVKGALDKALLKMAIEQVIERHEILRTTFRRLSAMDLPLQVIADTVTAWQFEVHDLRHLTAVEHSAQEEAIWQEVTRLACSPEQGPLMKVWLVTLRPEQHVLFIKLSVMYADEASLDNFVRDLSRCYQCSLQGTNLNHSPVQYADAAQVLNELLQGEETSAGRKYWSAQVLTSARTLRLPYEVDSRTGFKPRSLNLALSSEVERGIEVLAKQHDTSAFVLLLACWKTLLWRLTSQAEIVVGTDFDGRTYEGLEEAMGFFVRSLPIKSQFQAKLRFVEVLEALKQKIAETNEFQEYFEPESWTENGDSTPNTFAFRFSYRRAPSAFGSAANEFRILQRATLSERFRVKLSCVHTDESLAAEFHYDASLLRIQDIERLAGEFLAILTSVIDDQNATLDGLKILSETERRQVLVEWNATSTDERPARCIHHLFEEQVRQRPVSTALIFEDHQLTYGELDARANQLARYLQKLHIGPERTVGICLERSAEIIVALLGIFKAGGAYLSLESTTPSERLRFMLEDSGAKVLLTQSHLLELLPNSPAITVCLDTEWSSIAKEKTESLQSETNVANLAYVIYTSGSSGAPKAVAVEHRQLSSYLAAVTGELELASCASFATVSTLSADLGHTAIYPALCGGGTLHVIGTERAMDGAALGEYFSRHTIDCLKIVPSHFASLLSTAANKPVLPRQRLILGGEATSWELVDRIARLHPGCEIANHYGPTETTVGALTYRMHDPSARRISATLPLGRPLPNTRLYILDRELNAQPVGVAGEIYIGGAGVSRGYVKQPGMTAEKFIPDLYGDEAGARLYRTGDVGRHLGDGNVEFLGRVDEQVKLRGYRIELGEIEAALQSHAAVSESVVVAREESNGERRLVGYVVPGREASGVTSSELRTYLQAKLPDYMVPSALLVMAELPLTRNGKVDRRSLPAPEQQQQAELAASYVAPRTAAEELMAGIWQEVLGVKQVGVNDNFFELGGHSLLATQVFSRTRDVFQLELQFRLIFESPTLAEFTAAVEGARENQSESKASPIVPVSRNAYRMQVSAEHLS